MKVPRTKKAMTLVEILLASFILVSVLIPIGGLIFGGLRSSESSKSFNMGANIAANVMDQLLSAEIPFRAIDPEGGPTVGEIAGIENMEGSNSSDSLISGMDSRKTAGFSSGYDALEDKIFGALGQPQDGCSRVIYDKGYIYEVYWFVGVYKDEVSGEADHRGELTFSFFKNPYVPVYEDQKTNITLSDPSKAPYVADYEVIHDPISGAITDPKDPRSRPGWPDLGSSEDDWKEQPTYQMVDERAEDGTLDLSFPLIFTDLEEFNEPDGALLKMIVGVRWAPKSNVRRDGVGAQRRSHEFWLVSVKGRIQEG